MDTEAFLKYDQPSFDHNDFLYNPEEEDFSFPPKTILENLDSLPSNINQHQNNNHTNSFISTNCSFKNTPEHEILSVDSLNNDRRLNAIPKVRKNIYKKYYEPIFDNQLIYRYEDDPVEYRKARK